LIHPNILTADWSCTARLVTVVAGNQCLFRAVL
jgi:hypothetical protein